MKRLFLLLLLCTSCSVIFAQEKVNKNLTMRSKFISFENAKLSVGWHGEIGGAIFSEKMENYQGTLRFATGPAFDYYMPFSVVGLSSSVNYKFTRINFNPDPKAEMASDSLISRWVSVPLFLRIKIGGVSKPTRLVFMPGIEYSYPFAAELRSIYAPTVKDTDVLNKHMLYYRFQIAAEYITDNKKDTNQNTSYRTRFLIYFSLSYSPTPIINPNFSDYPTPNLSELSKLADGNETNFSFGLSFYHTFSSW